MLRSDLAAARQEWIGEAATEAEREAREKSDFLAYRNAAGDVADFHATRHTYVSGIVAGGASVKTCQELARHSSPSLTIGRYSHARLHDLQGALESLPSQQADTPAEPERQILAATGTDDSSSHPGPAVNDAKSVGHIWGQLGGEVLQNVASGGESVSNPTDEVDKRKCLRCQEKRIAGSRWRLPAKRGAGGSRTHDGGFAIRCLSHLATAPCINNYLPLNDLPDVIVVQQ